MCDRKKAISGIYYICRYFDTLIIREYDTIDNRLHSQMLWSIIPIVNWENLARVKYKPMKSRECNMHVKSCIELVSYFEYNTIWPRHDWITSFWLYLLFQYQRFYHQNQSVLKNILPFCPYFWYFSTNIINANNQNQHDTNQ